MEEYAGCCDRGCEGSSADLSKEGANAGAVEVWRVLFRMERETDEADDETGVAIEDTEVRVVLRVGDGVGTESGCSRLLSWY